jgi:polyphosphate kinase
MLAVQVGGLMRQRLAGVIDLNAKQSHGFSPAEQLALISQSVKAMVDHVYEDLMGRVLPQLRRHGVSIVDYDMVRPSRQRPE